MAMVRQSTTLSGGGRLEIIIESGSQSTSGNWTQVRVRGIMYNTSGRSYDFTADGVPRSVTGTNSWSGSFNFDLASNASQTFIDVVFTVGHNSDGNKTVNYTVHLGPTVTGTFGNGGSVGASLALPKIGGGGGSPTLPGPPGWPALSHTPVGKVTVVFSGSSTNGGGAIREYQVQWSEYGDFRVEAGQSRGSLTQTRTFTLPIGKRYYFRVRAFNGGWGPWSDVRSIDVPDKPDRVSIPTTEFEAPDQVTLSWSAPDNGGMSITGYDIQYADNPSFSSAKLVSTTSRSRVFTGLEAGATIYFRVRAKNPQGAGAWSSASSEQIVSGPKVRYNSVWRQTIAYVRYNGVWRQAIPWVKHNGVWKMGGG